MKLVLATLAAVSWSLAQPIPQPQPWPQALHDAQRTSRSTIIGPGPLAPEHTYQFPSVGFGSAPVVTRIGRMFVTASYCVFPTPEGCFAYYSTLLSVSPRGQAYPAARDLTVQYNGTPALGEDGTIYISSGAGLRALFPDGRTKWTFPIQTGSPVLTPNGLILASGSNVTGPVRLYVLDLQGRLLWSKLLPPDSAPGAAFSLGRDGNIYYGAVSSYVVALDPAGNFRWRYPTGDQMHSLPLVANDGTVYASGDKLYALRPNGTLKWTFSAPGSSLSGSTPALATDGTLYIGSGARFVALNPDGTEKWSYPVPDPGQSALVDGEGSIHFFDGGGITALRSDGTLKWQRPTERFTMNWDTEFALTLDGTLIAMRNPYGMAIGPSALP